MFILQTFSQNMKPDWRRALALLLVLLTVVGMLPTTAFAADTAFAATGDFEVNIAGSTGWNGTCNPLPVFDSESGDKEITSVPASDDAEPVPLDMTLAKGDPEELYEYNLDGTAYRKYEAWMECDMPTHETSPENAKRLQKYCVVAGLIPHDSEWWQFDDPNMAVIMAKGMHSKRVPVNTAGNYAFNSIISVSPSDVLGRPVQSSPRKAAAGPTGVVTDLNTTSEATWKVKGTPLNVVWGHGKTENWDADTCRRNVTWYNSNAMQYNGMGSNAPSLMGGTVYAYDATDGYNQRWVTTADEFQAATGISDYEKSQMFHCHASDWSTGWTGGEYTSMWGVNPKPVTPSNEYMVYEANKSFLYLLNRLTEVGSGGGALPGWSEDVALKRGCGPEKLVRVRPRQGWQPADQVPDHY